MKWKLKLKGDKLPSGPIQVHIEAPGKPAGEPSYPKTAKTHLFGARTKK